MKDFFQGLSKLTLEMSLNNYFSLQSFNDHFAVGWIESTEFPEDSEYYSDRGFNDHFAVGWIERKGFSN